MNREKEIKKCLKLAASNRFLAKRTETVGPLPVKGMPMPARYYIARAEQHEAVAECFRRYPQFTGSGKASAALFEKVYEQRRTIR